MYDLPGIWKVSATHRNNPGATPISMAHIDNRSILLEKDGHPDSCRSVLQIYFGEEITKFNLCSHVHRTIYDCHRIRSTSYNQKRQWSMLQFQGVPTIPAMLQHHPPDKQPNHPRSNRFVERMVGVAKKLMDKAGKEGKPWISGLFDYRVTPQSGSIASPLQLMTQCTPRKKNLPQLPSALGAPEMHQTHQKLIKKQGSNSKPERKYQELLPGTPVWVQHKQNATWEPAIVVNQCAPNSYWIMQENSAEQPKVYRHTRSMLKIDLLQLMVNSKPK